MKKCSLVIAMLFAIAAAVSGNNDIVKSGTYENLISNGKLELYAGSFPSKWRYAGAEVEYKDNGGYANGGRFIFKGNGKTFLIRQDWTFTLIPGEKYYLKAKSKAKNFKAKKAVVLVFNNGWSKSFEINLPQGSGDWVAIEKIFDGMESKAGYYSIGIHVIGIRSGEIEVSDIAVEPASKRAFERSTEYLKEIPVPELVAIGRTDYIQASDAFFTCRWFGDKNLKKLSYSVADLKREANISEKGIVKFDFSGLKPGKHTVKVTAGAKTIDLPITVQPGFTPVKGKVLNNFHTIVAEIDASASKSGEFVNSRNGWMHFVMPENMVIRINGYKKAVKNKDSVLLPMGKLSFKVEKGSGKIKISEVSETAIYQLAGGPYPKGLPKHNWEFVKKYQRQTIMTFLGGGLKGAPMGEFLSGHNRLLGHAAIGQIVDHKKDTLINFGGFNKRYHWFNGIYIDELALSMPKSLVYYIKNLDKVSRIDGRDAYLYVTGEFPDTPYGAQVAAKTINLSANSKLLSEIYLGNNYTSEDDVKTQLQKLVNYAERINSVLPGINPYYGFHLCHSNIAGSFTLDNEPEADHRVLLDMQMHLIATHPAFKNIGAVGFWGDNYSDVDRTRFVMELLKHYVIEGKTTLYTAEKGLKLTPGIITNASFRNGIKDWTVKGKASSIIAESGRYINRFSPIHDTRRALAMKAANGPASITQTMKNLNAGQTYSIKVTTGADTVDVKINGVLQQPKVEYVSPKKGVTICGREYVFKATDKEMTLEVVQTTADSKKNTLLYYVSVLPYLGE